MDDLLIKNVLGEVDPSEQAEIQRRLAADELNRERFRQFSAAWDLSDRISPAAPDWQEAYDRFRQRVEHGRLTGTMHERRGRGAGASYRLGSGWKIAAVLTGFLCLATVLYVLIKKEPGSTVRLAVVTYSRPGPDTLPDGSVVKLGPKTTITYSFGRQTIDRTVNLKGQAFFTVAPDPSKPFVVHVSDLTINVLGTSFAVRETEDSTIVEMATGAVEVISDRARRVIGGGDTLRAYPHSDAFLVSGDGVKSLPGRPTTAIPGTDTTSFTGMHITSLARHSITPPAGRQVPATDPMKNSGDRKNIVRSIIREIVKEMIVPGREDIVWFALDNDRFIINDRQMPESLFLRFRSKYIGSDRQGYYYGPVKVVGHGYFFTKQEINDH